MNHMPNLLDAEVAFQKPRLRSLVEQYASVQDPREAAKVRFPQPEMLLLVVSVSGLGPVAATSSTAASGQLP